ncbi:MULTISPECIES: MFS transporter [unclassified Streptomyces]|uniref:MFS transporter n=1 Tax=unclassified Streptomyces TaxID=2593676 RepID=UPI00381C9856
MSNELDSLTATPGSASAVKGQGTAVSLALIVGCQLMVAIGFSSLNIALPAIRSGLNLSLSELSWVTNLYMLTFSGLLLLGGRAGDLLGRRRVFLAGIAVFTVSSLIGTLADSSAMLLVALVGQGAGAAFAEPASLSLIAVNFTEGSRRDRALAVFATAAGLGLAVGLLVGGLLSEISWRAALFVNVPLGLVILVGTPFVLRESPRNRGRFDVGGALTVTFGVVALVFGLTRAGSAGWSDGWVLGSFAAAIVLLVSAVLVEARASHPLVPLHLFRNGRRATAYINTVLVGTVGAGMLFCLTQFLEDIVGFSPIEAGFAFLPLAVTLFGAAVATPRLIARRGAKAVVVAGAASLTAGTFWLSFLSWDTSYAAGVLGPLLLIGAGQGSSVTALNSLILAGVPHGDSGAASGLQQSTMRIGASLGLAATVTMISTVGRAAPGEDGASTARAHEIMADGFGRAFALSSALIAVGLVIAVFLLRDSRPVARPHEKPLS